MTTFPVRKTCRRCGENKRDQEFNWHPMNRDFRMLICKPCEADYRRELAEKKRTANAPAISLSVARINGISPPEYSPNS